MEKIGTKIIDSVEFDVYPCNCKIGDTVWFDDGIPDENGVIILHDYIQGEVIEINPDEWWIYDDGFKELGYITVKVENNKFYNVQNFSVAFKNILYENPCSDKVFLGGTKSKWREKIIPQLKCNYFNPVVEDWTPEYQKIEEKSVCNIHLYVITPKMQGVYSIAEAVNDSALFNGETIFCVTKESDDRDWTVAELKSLDATKKLIEINGGIVLEDLDKVVNYLNNGYIL